MNTCPKCRCELSTVVPHTCVADLRIGASPAFAAQVAGADEKRARTSAITDAIVGDPSCTPINAVPSDTSRTIVLVGILRRLDSFESRLSALEVGLRSHAELVEIQRSLDATGREHRRVVALESHNSRVGQPSMPESGYSAPGAAVSDNGGGEQRPDPRAGLVGSELSSVPPAASVSADAFEGLPERSGIDTSWNPGLFVNERSHREAECERQYALALERRLREVAGERDAAKREAHGWRKAEEAERGLRIETERARDNLARLCSEGSAVIQDEERVTSELLADRDRLRAQLDGAEALARDSIADADRLRAEVERSRAHGQALANERDAACMELATLRTRLAECETKLKSWPSLECPCCGEEGAFARYFEDGQATVCGCGGTVMADGDAHITVDETECPKCTALSGGEKNTSTEADPQRATALTSPTSQNVKLASSERRARETEPDCPSPGAMPGATAEHRGERMRVESAHSDSAPSGAGEKAGDEEGSVSVFTWIPYPRRELTDAEWHALDEPFLAWAKAWGTQPSCRPEADALRTAIESLIREHAEGMVPRAVVERVANALRTGPCHTNYQEWCRGLSNDLSAALRETTEAKT